MVEGRPPREPGEDPVAYGNRCLRAAGRTDVRWQYNGRGGTELVPTKITPGLKPESML